MSSNQDSESLRRLWAPWRMKYIEEANETTRCIFCEKPAQHKDKENFILYRGKTAFFMLNAFPYNTGHLMIAPFKHAAEMEDLDDIELLEIAHLVRYSVRLLRATAQPDGFNLGVNLGRTAGAGIVDHIHWHVVPRWDGDTNFMPVVAGTKVLPESLESTYDKLTQRIDELGVP